MGENYLEKRLDPEFIEILTNPPAYLGALTSDKILRIIGRETVFPVPDTPPDPEVIVSERLIPGPQDAPDIPVRIYEPKIKTGILPGILYFHYGGYAIGSPKHEDATCYRYVKEVNCIIVSPDYRMAPENPAPAAYEDCYAALLWLSENATELGIDRERLAVTGFSSGGGLSIAVALMTRDRKGPRLAFQMPIAPTIDDRMLNKSTLEFIDPRALNFQTCKNLWNQYLGKGHEIKDDISCYAAPSRAKDFSGLPPCYTYVGDLDPHRDETIDYITRLTRAGVPAGFTLYPGGIHGFELEIPDAQISKHAVSTAIWSLKRALRKGV